MVTIWDRKSFEDGGHWPLWRGGKKTIAHSEPTKVEHKKNKNKKQLGPNELKYIVCCIYKNKDKIY